MGLNVKDLSFGYKKEDILKEIDISADNGDMVALLGPNGSGKTTLLKLLSKILCPRSGVITLGDKDIESLTARDMAREMAIIPQQFDTNFSFTAEDIVMMGRTPHLGRWQLEGERDHEIVKNAMIRTNTWQFRNKNFSNLSGGEKQRVVISRALAQEPNVLLLDEPTSSLDINHQIEILSTVRSLVRERGILVLAAFHDLNLAAKYFDRIILLNQGRIHASGIPEKVLTEKNIKDVYGVDVLVKNNPITDSIYVVPVSKKDRAKVKRDLRVHVVCGEGSGSSLLNLLDKRDYLISVGVLNMMDTDHETAMFLEVADIVVEAPFSPISYENHIENIEHVKQCDVLVMSDFSIGVGNLKNLEAGMVAINHDIPVVIYEQRKICDKDFTSGEGTHLYNELVSRGAIVLTSKKKIIEYCEERAHKIKERSENARNANVSPF